MELHGDLDRQLIEYVPLQEELSGNADFRKVVREQAVEALRRAAYLRVEQLPLEREDERLERLRGQRGRSQSVW